MTPDRAAWEELVCLGSVLGDRTPLEEITRLGVGQHIEVSAAGVSFETVWTPDVPPAVTRDRYITRNNDLLLAAFDHEHLRGERNVLPLSGGHDSRRLFAASRQCNLDVSLVTQSAVHAEGTDGDARSAVAIAQRARMPIEVADLSPPEGAYRDTALCDRILGFECARHEWLLPMLRGIRAGANVIDGIAGGTLVSGHHFRSLPQAMSRYDDPGWLADATIRDPSNPLRHNGEAPLRDRVMVALKVLPDHPHRLTWFYLLNHARRSLGCRLQLYLHFGLTPVTPYLYFPLVHQALTLPVADRLEGWMQMACLERWDAELARLPGARDRKGPGVDPAAYRAARKRTAGLPASFRARYLAVRWLKACGVDPALAGREWRVHMVDRTNRLNDWIG